ncbi:nuclear transport factor 2 family protein [Cerasicoccus fimbriatus]|uniref:nuclear transport factor 2 family protein n=1 Tax=Cerasicoccus fimbriatus TaxID=3014554 RepID=UPI0022B31CBD|nr:nuclear transport factor 2 family protein [Cerasicoccus sp. TK19100]
MSWLQQNLKIALISLGIAAVAIFFIVSGESGPEAEINGLLDKLCDKLSYETQPAKLSQLTSAKELSGYFTEDPYLLAWPGRAAVTSRDGVSGVFMYVFSYASEADVSMSSRQVTIDGNRAIVTATITGRATVAGDSERHSGRYRIELEKIDGDWLIASTEPIN